MANIVQFAVDDTSPTIVYSPFADTLSSPRLDEGWNPFFSQSAFASALGVQGNGTSYHVTSRDAASLTIVWTGTAIQLQGIAPGSESYTVNLDGRSPGDMNTNLPGQVLATLSNLPYAEHTLTLTTILPNSDPPQWFSFQRAIIASNMTSATSNVNDIYQLNYLLDNEVGFHGKWSFGQDGVASYHQSDAAGDRAIATFRGAAFLLEGTTSPESGNYSVTIDNKTVSYSAKSSFLSHDTLLHYSTGLDPTINHTVTVTNQGGGTLTLREGGFGVYASQNTPTTITVSATATSFSKGTIAAFALAGILAFLLMTAFLYFYFIYRPRKKFQLERERWRTSNVYPEPKAEMGAVLNITHGAPTPAPGTAHSLEANQHQSRRSRRESGKSSFSRWKREVENAVARDSLGIQFRHSSLYSEKIDPQHDNATVQSTSTRTRSSRSASILRNAMFMANIGRGSRDGNGKQKGRSKGKESRRPPLPEGMPSEVRTQASTLGSLSYMTAPAGAELNQPTTGEGYPGSPPSYAASISHRNSGSPPSVPRSVTQGSSIPTVLSPNTETRAEQAASPVTSQASLTPPYLVRDLSKEDRGSLMDQSIDETPNVLSGPAVRQVIRSLSPRTSRANYPRNAMSTELTLMSPTPPTATQSQSQPHPRRVSRPLPVLPSSPLPSPTRSDSQEGPVDRANESEPTSPTTEEGPITVGQGPQRSSSGTFGPRVARRPLPSLPPPPRSPTSLSFVPGNPGRSMEVPSTTAGRFSMRVSRLIPRPDLLSRKLSRASTLATLLTAPSAELPSDPSVRDSFLDFTTSSDVSAHSHSKDNTDTSSLKDDTRRYSTPPQIRLDLPGENRSRWSSSNSGNDTTGSGNESSSGSQLQQPPGAFNSIPSPITIPPPAQFLHITQPTRFSISASSTRSDPVHVHPPLEYLESPTDSIPMSGSSDVGFRHGSDSDEVPHAPSRIFIEDANVRASVSTRSSYPSVHAPTRTLDDATSRRGSPPSQQQDQEPSSSTPQTPAGLSSPNFIVQRVLGLHSPTSSVAARPSVPHSRTGSSSAFTNTPFGSGRFDSNPSHLRHTTNDTDTSWSMNNPKDPS